MVQTVVKVGGKLLESSHGMEARQKFEAILEQK